MESLHPPDECFAKLPDWPHPPRYVDAPDGEGGSLRMHYVDGAPAENIPRRPGLIRCLHGQPTWSYLYRKRIPIWTAAGHSVVAPELARIARDFFAGTSTLSRTSRVGR